MTDSPFFVCPPDTVPGLAQDSALAVAATQARSSGPALAPETLSRIDAQVEAFIAGLQSADVGSDAFRELLHQAFHAGRKQVADAVGVSNAFTRRNFSDDANSPAYKAITEARELLDSLNPSKQGDLLAPSRILGLIPSPFGSRLKRYLRKFQSADAHIRAVQTGLGDARELVRLNVNEVGAMQDHLWSALGALQGVDEFLSRLESRLNGLLEPMREVNPARARALEDEVLYYVRQNLGDIRSTQAVVIQSHVASGILVRTGRETMNACERVATLGVAALHLGATMARAVGEQAQVRKVVQGTQQVVDELLHGVNATLKEHVAHTGAMSESPVLGVERMQALMNEAFSVMDELQAQRAKSAALMAQKNAAIREDLTRHMQRLATEREAAGNLSVLHQAPALDLDFTAKP